MLLGSLLSVVTSKGKSCSTEMSRCIALVYRETTHTLHKRYDQAKRIIKSPKLLGFSLRFIQARKRASHIFLLVSFSAESIASRQQYRLDLKRIV